MKEYQFKKIEVSESLKKAKYLEKFNELIFPMFYDDGILIKSDDNNIFYYYKENLLRTFTLENIIEKIEENGSVVFTYPDNVNENLTIKNILEYLYTRLLHSSFMSKKYPDLIQILEDILLETEIHAEKYKYMKNKKLFKG